MKYPDEMVNRDTGEILPVHVVQKKRVDWSFVQLRQESSIELSKNERLTFAAFKVLHWLMGSVNHNCFVRASQIQIASGVGLSRQAVNRALKCLEVEKIISYSAIEGYELNKNMMRRGGGK